MTVYSRKTHHSIAALGLAVVAVAGAVAQMPCHPVQNAGREIRQFSRNVRGEVRPGKSTQNPNASSVVFLMNCQPADGGGVASRQVNYAQIRMDLSDRTGCDELPKLDARLEGDYFSLTRISDPFPNPMPNVRVGRHNATGRVLNPAGAVIGTFTMQGTVSTNTQRPVSMFGVGPCYWCLHHEGLILIRLYQSPLFVGSGQITATYAFDVKDNDAACSAGPCKFEFTFEGTMDGIAEAACGTIHM